MSTDTEVPVQERKQSPGKRGLVDLGDARRGVYGVWAAFVLLLIVAAIARPALMQVSSLKTVAVLAAITAIVGSGPISGHLRFRYRPVNPDGHDHLRDPVLPDRQR